MPEETTPEVEATAPAEFAFPFQVPADFSAASDDQLHELLGQLHEFAGQYRALPRHEHTEATVRALEESGALATRIGAVFAQRGQAAETASTTFSALDNALNAATSFKATAAATAGGEEDEDDVDTDQTPEAVTASGRRGAPSAADVARRGGTTPQLPATMTNDTPFATMRAGADAIVFRSGEQLLTFKDAGRALAAMVERNPAMTAGRAQFSKNRKGKLVRPVTVYDPRDPGRKFRMENYTRSSGIEFARHFPEELRVDDGKQNGYAIAEFAMSDKRLFGNSLVESAKMRIKSGRALTAAAAWCAPSEVIYQLCELETLDGMLSVPEMQTSRGGWQIPIDGGPNFASIWNGIGNAGNTHLDEEDVQDDVAKVCNEIPCPDFEDVRLGVDYVCLTGGLLQRRGYPEVVARFSRGAMIALQHKINAGVLATIEAQSLAQQVGGLPIVVPQVDTGDDAASALLAAVDMAITDVKYRNRMGMVVSVEVIMPLWFIPVIRAALSRRRGVYAMDVTDAEIMDWFATRRASPQFVYDWQDAYTTAPLTGPGGATPITQFPAEGRFMVYPTGTWVKAVQDVVSLDTIYDSTNLQTNQYTAIFAEDGWAMLQMCPDSRVYEVALDVSGVVGCCPPELNPSF